MSLVLIASATSISIGYSFVQVSRYAIRGGINDDDTQPIQDAIDDNPGRTIILPKPIAQYNITKSITVASAGTYLGGENRQTKIVNQGTGDAVVVGPSDPGAGILQGGNGVFGLTITRASNIGTGVGLKINACSRASVTDVQLLEHVTNLHLLGNNSCRYTNLTVGGGSVFTGGAGSSGIRISTQPLIGGGTLKSLIQQFDTFSVGGGNGIWDDCVLVEAGDTAFFANGYVSYPKNNLFRVKAGIANSPIVSLNLSQVYLDGVNTGTDRVGVRVESDGQTTSNPSYVTLSNCTVGQLGQGVVSDEPGLGRLLIGGLTEFHNIEQEAIKIAAAPSADVHVTGALFYNCGRKNVGGNIVSIDGASTVQFTSNLGKAGSFPNNTFLKLKGTIGEAVIGPNAKPGFSIGYDTATANIENLIVV